jgi:Flp pilus assembly protein TadG
MVGRQYGAKRGGERGTAAVEFALVLPLVLVMSLAIVQVGLLVKDLVLVEESARAGAREAAVSADDEEVRQAVVAAAVGLDDEQLDVTVAREGGAGSAVTVTVVYHSSVEVPLVTWLFPDSVDLKGTAVMRQETG